MNRRTALMLSMFLGGLIPRGLWAQTAARKSSKTHDKALQPVSRSDDPDDAAVPPSNDEPPAPFAPEPGFQWRRYPITRYTKAASSYALKVPAQQAIIDWIFKRTGLPEWHGEKVAVLSASKTELRAYNSPEILKQVDEIVERFTNATEDVLSVRVQFLAAVDTRWRYSVYSRLTFVGSGPQGQQIWTMRLEDAALVLSQMQVQQGFRKLMDRRVEMINGQTLMIKTSEARGYASGLQRDGAVGAGFQPKADKLEESILLKLSPLLNFDGDALDAMIDLTINTVRSFHRTKVIAPRDVGPSEMSVDVPESSQTHLDQTVRNWPLGQTLVISGGIHPGILDKKGGWFNLQIPGTYPTGTEVLVVLDAETVTRAKAASRSSTETVPKSSKVDSRSRSRNSDSAPADDENPPPDR
jgi:hypothetical protein